MADEKVETPEKTTDLVAAIEAEGGTLASLQAKAPRLRFDAATEQVVEETPPAEGGEAAAPPEEEKAEKKEEAPPEEKPKPKYASQEEAEAAQKEAERKMHEATTKAAEEAKAREAAEKERDELKAKLEETLAKAPEKEEEKPPVPDAERAPRVRSAIKKALNTIRELNREDDNYNDQVEEAWASALIEAGMGGQTFTQAEVDKMVKASMKAEKEAADKAAAEKAAVDAGQQAWQSALDQGKKAGLTLDDKMSADYRIFDSLERDLASVMPEDLKGKPLTEIVDWMVKETRRLTGKVVEQTDAEREKAKKTQVKNTVLTQGTKAPPVTTEPETYTLAELQRQMREKQQARHRGA